MCAPYTIKVLHLYQYTCLFIHFEKMNHSRNPEIVHFCCNIAALVCQPREERLTTRFSQTFLV